MGAIVSVLPVLGASVGAGVCLACCTAMGGTKLSVMTRITYAAMLAINSLLLWFVASPFFVKQVERASFGFINNKCGPDGLECIRFTGVHRINFALAVLHLILAGLLWEVKLTSNPRAVIQNGGWIFKFVAWFVLIVVDYVLIPDTFFVFWGNKVLIVFSTVFIAIGLVLLVDFAHAWAEKCLEKIELEELTGEGEYNAGFWKKLLVGGTLSMYVASIVLMVLMYVFFAGSGCSMNRTAITLNVVLLVVISLVSINQRIQESNPRAGLAQLSMVVFYCTYLVMSAVASEPDDKLCNPLVRSKGTRTASIVIGALFTFVAITYTTTRAASNSAFFDEEPDVVLVQPQRNEMRYQAIRQAVDEGSLPESALQQLDLYDEAPVHEEHHTVKYNYSTFHVIFFLATQYVATLLTINVQKDDVGDFVPVGRTYFASWVKIISSWLCFALYGWSLVAPVLYPDRFALD